MRVAFITKETRCHSIYPSVREALELSGIETDEIVVEQALLQMSEIAPRADLYVLRTRAGAGFSAAAALCVAGARLFVPLERERVARNRFLVQRTLVASGIPTPRGYIAARAGDLAPILRSRGPLILKPYDAGGGKRVFVVRSENDLPPGLPEPVFAQELVEHSSADIKLYAIGSRIFAIRRRFPAVTIEEKRGIPFMPTDEMADIAGRCRQAFGLELFGVDLLESDRGLVAVDVNSMPGYKGVNGAAGLIAELIRERI